MGMYDTILVPCPKCGEKGYFQTKGGECTMEDYEFERAPADAMSDVNRHGPHECVKCGTWFEVAFKIEVTEKKIVSVDPPCRCIDYGEGPSTDICPAHRKKA